MQSASARGIRWKAVSYTHLIDTAGLRDSDDPIEQLGVERSRAAMDEAALVLLVVDGTEKPTQEDADLARTIAEADVYKRQGWA